MAYDRRPDRRGGRQAGGRPDRPPRDRERAERPPREFGDRPPRDFGERPGGRSYSPRPQGRPYAPRADDGGMSIRLDPRRLSALKLLAAEAGIRPGELVTHWIEERLDAARAGGDVAAKQDGLREVNARLDELARRVDALASASDGRTAPEPAADTAPQGEPASDEPAPAVTDAPRRGPGRPRKQAATTASARPIGKADGPRVPLHEEIAAVIAERGPMTAADLARAITERGRYAAPRSSRPLDATTVSSRVSNPVYRARFTRTGGRIGLAEPA